MNTSLIAMWKEGRTRFTQLLDKSSEADLVKKNGDSPNSAGFLIRHIAEVELLFAKNVFGLSEVKIVAKTLIAVKDTGEWTNLAELKEIAAYAAEMLEKAISLQENWEEVIETKEFGKKTRAEALGRITTHTAYHAGQLALVLKYGK
ncbi:DinB family protein [Algoriphagus aquaeductus]|uniref:DinB family protein n=1 Tax=Algoriphagus aquaeductus TaxID=475299 RepID=A0A326RYF3_9BACT|nr:DinB family protein [Algoriphagus aquaeductus]PZV86494.1 DinB family protein [Algoriphagus aquaeductus]